MWFTIIVKKSSKNVAGPDARLYMRWVDALPLLAAAGSVSIGYDYVLNAAIVNVSDGEGEARGHQSSSRRPARGAQADA